MGWRNVANVRDYSRATGSAYTVAIMLAERAPDETRIARPGLKQLALDARSTRSTVQRALKVLEELGEFEAVAHRDGGRGKATEWLVLVGPEMYETKYGEEEGSQSATPPERVSPRTERASSRTERVAPVLPLPEGTEEQPNSSPTGSPSDRLAEQAQEIFEFWARVFGKGAGTKFTPGRRKAVLARLKEGYTVERLKRAILGCAGSEFHVKGGHTDLTLICRNGEKVEQFEARPEPPNGLAVGVAGGPNGPEPQRRDNDGVPEISLDGGATWETDYDEAIRRRSERGRAD